MQLTSADLPKKGKKNTQHFLTALEAANIDRSCHSDLEIGHQHSVEQWQPEHVALKLQVHHMLPGSHITVRVCTEVQALGQIIPVLQNYPHLILLQLHSCCMPAIPESEKNWGEHRWHILRISKLSYENLCSNLQTKAHECQSCAEARGTGGMTWEVWSGTGNFPALTQFPFQAFFSSDPFSVNVKIKKEPLGPGNINNFNHQAPKGVAGRIFQYLMWDVGRGKPDSYPRMSQSTI